MLSGVTRSGSSRSGSALPAISSRAHAIQPSRAAYSRGVNPPLFMSLGRGSVMTLRSHWRTTPRALTSAPRETSSRTISGWLCAAAHIKADCPPQVSLAFTSACASSSRLAASTLPRASDRHQRCFAFRVPGVRIGAGLEQRVEDRRRADDRGFGDRRRAELVLQVDVGVGLDQRADEIDIVVRRGQHDGRRPVGPGRIRVGALGQQLQRGRAIATLRRLEERIVRGGCNRARGDNRDHAISST